MDLIVNADEFVLTYNLSTPSQTDLIINNQWLPVFLIPGDTLFMTMNLSDSNFLDNIKFEGKYASINEYKQKRRKKLKSNFEQKCAKLINSKLQIVELQNSIDSISAIEMNFLNDYTENNQLPEWYLTYERNQTLYNSTMAKITKLEPELYDKFLNDIEINNPDAIICPNYYGFLNTYFEKFIPEQIDIDERRKILGLKYLQAADSLLTEEVEEIYKCYIISSFIIDFGMYELASKVINEEKDKMMNVKYINYLEEYLKDRTTLTPGVTAPDFRLLDINNQYKTLGDYKGNVILLNFWFPGCTPCIQEIPYEQELVNDFEGKDFRLINICFFSTEENWYTDVNKFKMRGVHLLANENWQKRLIEEYKIGGYPHYTLIDKDGKIISNNPKRPSGGVSEDILKLLN